MPLHPPGKRRERTLVFGRHGSGKSRTWGDMCIWRQRTKATFHVYVGDTDHAWDAMDPDGEFDDFVHVTDLRMGHFREWIEWARLMTTTVKREDLLVVDLLDKAWPEAETYHWTKRPEFDMLADAYAKSREDDLLPKGTDKFNKAGAHGTEWDTVKKYYGEFFGLIMNMPCHVLCTAHAKEITDNDKPEIRKSYAGLGWRPAGPGSAQAELGNFFHSVIFCAQAGDNDWRYTTVKEITPLGKPGRAMMKGEKSNGFVSTYLCKVAGWSLGETITTRNMDREVEKVVRDI